MQVFVLRRLHRTLRHVVPDVDGRILLPDDLLEERRVDPLAPRALDEARVDGRGDGVRVVRIDTRAPEEALRADGFPFGVPEPGSRYADRVGAVYLQRISEAGQEVRADGHVEFGADRGVQIWHRDDG